MKKKKVCWKITTRCNQKCNYCFGFKDIQELSYADNKRAMDNLIVNGLTDITWTGGEAVLYPQLNELIKYAKENGIRNKLVTNGIFLSKNNNEYVEDILNNLDEIDLSIDSISNEINLELGKENNHYEIIKNLLEKAKNKALKIGINTVVSKKNIDSLNELGEFLNCYKIHKWKFLKFMPIREKSLVNKNEFDVDEQNLKNSLKRLKKFENINSIIYKSQDEFEKSLVVLPNGELIQTQNGNDFKLGNVLLQDKLNLEGMNVMNKIRTLVAHNDDDIRNSIVNSIKVFDYVEIVATAKDGVDTYNKIVELRPEVVFSEYNFNDMPGLELVRKTKNELKDKFPSFNTIGMIPEDELEQVVSVTGSKLNAFVSRPYGGGAKDIIQAYKEDKYE